MHSSQSPAENRACHWQKPTDIFVILQIQCSLFLICCSFLSIFSWIHFHTNDLHLFGTQCNGHGWPNMEITWQSSLYKSPARKSPNLQTLSTGT